MTSLGYYAVAKYYLKQTNHALTISRVASISALGLVAGGTLGIIITVAKAYRDQSMDAVGISDRGYRIVNNVRQARVDEMAGVGAITVGLLGYLKPSSLNETRLFPFPDNVPKATRLLGSAAVGTSIGLALFTFIYKNPMIPTTLGK